MEAAPRILSANPVPKYQIEIKFSNGIIKKYDCNPLLKRPEFFLLKNESFFNSAKVDPGGYGISWNEDIDLSEHEVWTNGTEI